MPGCCTASSSNCQMINILKIELALVSYFIGYWYLSISIPEDIRVLTKTGTHGGKEEGGGGGAGG